MKALIVGDPHATVDALDDCKRLIDYTIDVARREGVDTIIFMGDLNHTHSVLRVEVLCFWLDAFESIVLHTGCQIYLLVGNHDFAGEGLNQHSLKPHRLQDKVTVVDVPQVIAPGVVATPYIPEHGDRFAYEHINVMGNVAGGMAGTLICHQTFHGAKYENGMYAPEGLDPDKFRFRHIISGHIHTPQAFGKVEYVGSPRWQTINDANVDRAICLYEFNDQGDIVNRQAFLTNDVCRQIRTAKLGPGDKLPDISAKDDWAIDLHGPQAWIEEFRPTIPAGVRVRVFPARERTIKVKESEGIEVALSKYTEAYEPKYGTPKDILASIAKERLHV